MKINDFEIAKPASGSVRLGLVFALAWLLIGPSLVASPSVTTLGGGNPNINPKYQGYKDGTTLTTALFRTPYALALDETFGYLYVADRDNNAIRIVDLSQGQTYTFVSTNLTIKPVGVAVDGDGNVFVLNRGSTNSFSTNGSVLTFDTYGNLLATNATKLTNAASIALDTAGNIYVTVRSNSLLRIEPNGSQSIVATITNAGTSLQGIVVKHNGLIAACDSGRHGIYFINPVNGNVTTNAGFNGAGDGTGTANHGVLKASAQFNQPMGITEAGDGSLVVTDSGNHRVKVVNATTVTNLYGVSSTNWGGSFPGWYDGTVKVPDSTTPNAQARVPVGVVFASDGTVYTTEDYYHLIRKVTGAGLPQPPPPPPQVPTPQIGWVDFPSSASPPYSSVFNPVSSFVFNNDAPIIIKGTAGSQTYYNYLNTPNLGLVPDPSSASASASPGYQDGLDSAQVNALAVAGIAPFVAIKAIGEKNDGSPNSAIAQAIFQYITANPNIGGNNAAQFIINDITFGATLFYTTDGSDPKTSPTAIARGFNPSTNLIINRVAFNFSSNNFLFKCYARKANYQDSGVVSNYFSAAGFTPNRISFGLTNGEPSSTFVARPGQVYYSPVTLQLQPGGESMYSLQFNVAVTNGLATPNKIVNGAGIGFFPMLMSLVPSIEGTYYPPIAGQWFLPIPCLTPYVSSGSTNLTESIFINTNNNLLGVGWLYRTGYRYKMSDTNGVVFLDFDTSAQDLIAYSIAHDTLFSKGSGTVIAGAYSFRVPAQANIGDQYFIQLGSPSGTRDGVGAPGADVYIQAPAESQAITVGSPSYVVGDAAPFRWLNAGDFGEGMLNNADVMQVFQSAIQGVDMPPANSDLYAALDSSGTLGSWDSVNKYYTDSGTPADMQALFDGNDETINTNVFGDTVLDVSDVYVTYRRSLDPSLVWFSRYWTNNQFVAVPIPNLAFNSNTPHLLKKALTKTPLGTSYQQSSVTFSAGDAINSAGQTVQIPITANIFGNYPIRVLGLNLTVHPLDGSPAITQAIQFTPAASLGLPTITASRFAANYSAAWLSTAVSGLTSNATLGVLTVTLPTNATSSSAYAVHFDHASASPNGLASFPEQALSGLITLTSRTNSSYNDGIPDSWRLRWFGTIYNSLSVSNADACGDGINNYQKFIAGTDPTAVGSYPQLKSKTPVPAGATTAIHWPTVSGKKYAIERSASLFPGAWTTITTNTGTGTDMEFNDSSTGSVKFYRVRILP